MNSQTKKDLLSGFLNLFPNRNDNLKQLLIKLTYIVVLIALLVSSFVISSSFIKTNNEYKLILDTRNSLSDPALPTKKELFSLFKQNSDFKGWINISGTNISNPIYQTTNNKFYLTHNQLKQKSPLGALFFDSKCNLKLNKAAQNLVIYGKATKQAQLFSDLKKYKNASFYNNNPTINLTTNYQSNTYVIFSAFLINSSPKDDNGKIFNYKQTNFKNEIQFQKWLNECLERSYLKTDVPVSFNDQILTLVTDSNEFKGAKFIVVARKAREDEFPNSFIAQANTNPRFPAVWYSDRNIDYPF